METTVDTSKMTKDELLEHLKNDLGFSCKYQGFGKYCKEHYRFMSPKEVAIHLVESVDLIRVACERLIRAIQIEEQFTVNRFTFSEKFKSIIADDRSTLLGFSSVMNSIYACLEHLALRPTNPTHSASIHSLYVTNNWRRTLQENSPAVIDGSRFRRGVLQYKLDPIVPHSNIDFQAAGYTIDHLEEVGPDEFLRDFAKYMASESEFDSGFIFR